MNISPDRLKKLFDQEMMNVYMRAKSEANYHATVFYQMLRDHGGVETANRLIHSPNPSDGYTALHLRNRLDLTVEAVIVDNAKWHPLFTDETVAQAKQRLKKYGYPIKSDNLQEKSAGQARS